MTADYNRHVQTIHINDSMCRPYMSTTHIMMSLMLASRCVLLGVDGGAGGDGLPGSVGPPGPDGTTGERGPIGFSLKGEGGEPGALLFQLVLRMARTLLCYFAHFLQLPC